MRQLAAANPQAGGAATDPLRPRRLFLGGLAIGVTGMSVVGLATALFIESPNDLAARSAVPPATNITAAARWQVLRKAITVQGAVRSARRVAVTATAPYATVTITRMPVRSGERVLPGHVLAEVDGRPIVLLQGRLPAYRDLHNSDQGPDVAQLQRALESLGYADFDPDGFFGASTEFALTLFYRNLGYAAPVYHPRPRTARRGSAAGHTADQLQPPSVYLPRSEVVFIPSKSALVTAVNARVGDLVRGTTVLTLATGNPYVSAELSQHQAAAIRRRMSAEIVTPAGRTLAGSVTSIGSVPSAGGTAGGYRVLVRPRRSMPQRLIGSKVRLTLLAPVTSGPVLTVPAAAILAGPRQVTEVVKVAAGRRSRVAVYTGPSADGLVAVQPLRPGDLRPGDRVLIGTGRWPPTR
jgi:membrane fusion protein, multidrug efflux system